MEAQSFKVQDIWDLLYQNGAGTKPMSQIRIFQYQEIIPSQEFLKGLKKIGEGGFGNVYILVLDEIEYALKLMTQKRGMSQEMLINNFYMECKSLLSVNHQRVLRLLGVSIDTNIEGNYSFCHLTNYQQKGNLFNLIQNKQLFPEDQKGTYERFFKKIRLLGQIAEGVNAIHANNLIHRDIKSLNILLDENDSPKIIDLGMTGQAKQITYLGRGTAQWQAPELYDHKVDFKSDI